MNIVEEKEQLRRRMREQLKKQPPELRRSKSGLVLGRLMKDLDFQKSNAIMFYVSTDEEVDTVPLLKGMLKAGRAVAVPFLNRTNGRLIPVLIRSWKELEPGSYDVLEPRPDLAVPFDVQKIDLILVPGLAFDRSGNRIGRGKGYYDRFLNTLPSRAKRYGLAFDFQLVRAVPSTTGDERVDRVITNEK